MNLDDLLEKLKDSWNELFSRIQSNPSFNTLQEKWEQLSPTLQKLILTCIAVLIGLFIFSIPYGFHSNSEYEISKFETNRSLLRKLLRAGRLANDASQNVPTMTVDDVKNQLTGKLTTFGLVAEQMAGINNISSETLGGNMAGGGLQQDGLSVNLKKLNLKQIQEIGFQIQDIGPAVKLAGIEVEAGSPDPHYFNVIYKLVVYRMPGVGEAKMTGDSKNTESDSDDDADAPGSEDSEE